MRIGVISDTHGMVDEGLKAVSKMGEVNFIIHLGDYLEDSKYIHDKSQIEIVSVKGNCDNQPHEKDEIILNLGSHKLLGVHGHQYGVKMSLTRLYYRALELECSIALYGHTHTPIITKYDDVLIMNPGSLGFPRGGSKPSFGIIEIKKDKINSEIIEI